MEQYSAIKSNKLLIHGTTWNDLKGIMLNEKSNLKRSHTYFMISFISMSQNDKVTVLENILGLSEGDLGGNGIVLKQRDGSSLNLYTRSEERRVGKEC